MLSPSHGLSLSLSDKNKNNRSFFLLLATLLRRREELLVTTGPKLRVLLAEILSPSAMATLLAGGETKNNKANATAALALWCQEAEALDLATPESFRHHLALIGEIAEAEYEVSDGGGPDTSAARAWRAEATLLSRPSVASASSGRSRRGVMLNGRRGLCLSGD